ncbi:hypothetical protein [Burkholderia gladioli]|uniref:hypothetical protein n=1 Tax=Burkholderia gladioli TaxID=28095 RepID=UPI00163FBF75|nr:hypothetical protein [Burkholderia gladioli]
MNYTISFTFRTDSSQDPLSAQLGFNSPSAITLTGNEAVQLSSSTDSLPPLEYLIVQQSKIAVQSHGATGGNTVSVNVSFSTSGSAIAGTMKLLGNASASVHYQFVGYANAGSIQPGNFAIPLPN